MATENNVLIPNFVATTPAATPPGMYNCVQALTRAMKKAGYKYKASSDGVTKDTTGLAVNDFWGGFTAASISNAGAGAASITAASQGRATVTGLTGIVARDKGRFLRIQGSGSGNNGYMQIEEILSATSVRIDNRTVVLTTPDANNGALTWEIHDPVLNTPVAVNLAGWWCAEGPSTLKIPITAAPVAGPSGFTFLRGENITQATTGFEGEILGFIFDTVGLTGHLVVQPRVIGTGPGVYGTNTAFVFTGDTSGATVTQVGSATDFKRQVVFWKGSAVDTTGSIFIETIEMGVESADLFSTLAASAGCTPIIAPGGGGTGNAFPAHAYVMWGTSTSGGHVAWSGCTSSGVYPMGRAQIMVADAIWEENWSADGTWTLMYPNLFNSIVTGCQAFGFWRLDDTEDGDLDPYITWFPGNVAPYNNSRASSGGARTSVNSTGGNDDLTASTVGVTWSSIAISNFRGWIRRGFSSGELFNQFETAALKVQQSSTNFALAVNPAEGERVQAQAGVVYVKEPLWVVSVNNLRKCRKGTIRWVSLVGGNSVYQLYDNKRLIQGSASYPAFVLGPWDGTTDPLIN